MRETCPLFSVFYLILKERKRLGLFVMMETITLTPEQLVTSAQLSVSEQTVWADVTPGQQGRDL